mgnify:CR=1 FL=1
MPTRRPKREVIEYYVTRIMLEYQRLLFIASLLLLIYAGVGLVARSPVGFVALLLGLHLLISCFSYEVVVFTARLAAWLLTLGRD